MYRGFNLTVPPGSALPSWQSQGIAHGIERDWPENATAFKSFLQKQHIDGDNLKAAWFPPVDTHVFISHSHADLELAKSLAGFLSAELGLNCFIDSLLWGNSADLLRGIDNIYCWSDDEKKTYDYRKRNYSTSHVHMMLASALSETMDRCECIIFLNTPRSIQDSDAQHPTKQVTGSPWIYHELITSKLLRKTLPDGRPAVPTLGLEERAIAMDTLSIQYTAPVNHLTKLSFKDLQRWAETKRKGYIALNWLYRNFRE